MRNQQRRKGITLIALVITIIILLILASVTITLIIKDNGLINNANKSSYSYKESQAKEKLELVLLDLQADKVRDINYNENDYINNRIKDNQMSIQEDIVFVDGFAFLIDRTVPKIVENKGSINQNSTKVFYLGSGNTFNLNILKEEGKLPKDLDLSNINIDNFIVGISSVSSGTTDVVRRDCWSRGWLFGNSIHKEYDENSRILTVNNTIVLRGRAEWAGGGSESKDLTISNPTFAYLVVGTIVDIQEIGSVNPNFEKVFYLGSGNNFNLNVLKEEGRLPKDLDLSSISIDNFIVGISSVSSGTTDVVKQNHWSRGLLFGNSVDKEYDEISGILTVNNTIVLRGRAEWDGGPESKDLTISNPTFAYLVIDTIEK